MSNMRKLARPLIAAAIALVAGLICVQAIRNEQSARLQAKTDAVAVMFSTRLEERLRSRLYLVDVLHDAVVNREENAGIAFADLASTLHARNTDIQALNWVDPDGVISIITPQDTNQAVLGLDIMALPVPSQVMHDARQARALRVSPPIELAQGGRGFVAFRPVFDGDTLLGYIDIVFRIEPLIASMAEDLLSRPVQIVITDQGASVWSTGELTRSQGDATSKPIAVGGRTWAITVSPTAEGIAMSQTSLDEMVLAFGLIVALLLAALIREGDRSRAKLIDREERFDLAMQGASDGIFDWNPATGETYYNPRWFQMIGYEPGELTPGLATFLSLLHPDDEPRIRKKRERAAVSDAITEEEFRMRHKNGSWVHIMSRATILRENGVVKRIVGTHVDITALRRQQNELELVARTDELTQLRNRRGLPDDLLALTETLGVGERVAIFHLDLDMFKPINDTLGHEAGDYALKTIAHRLREDPSRFDVLARIGGDEFILAKRISSEGQWIRHIANETIARITQPIPYNGNAFVVSASIGIDFLAKGSVEDVKTAISNADNALCAAKKLGRGRSLVFTGKMQKDAQHAAAMTIEIEDALRKEEFVSWFQPQIDIASGQVVAFEALARWNHPIRGVLAAGDFIPFAESCSLIKEVDEIILRQACQLAKNLPDMGWPDADVSVNMSTSQLLDPDLGNRFAQIAQEYEVPLSRLRVEILESTLLSERASQTAQNIRHFADLGVKMDLDDFGTGHSAISSLLNFPISRVKLDRSLIRNIHNDTRRQAIIEAIIEMCDVLNVEILAEGIEADDELRFLCTTGCYLAQGYLIGPPMPVSDLTDFAKRGDLERAVCIA